MAEAREQARQKALAGIKAAGEAGDWRALEAFLRMSFPADYRRDASVNVNASAAVQQADIVCDEAMRLRLIAQTRCDRGGARGAASDERGRGGGAMTTEEAT